MNEDAINTPSDEQGSGSDIPCMLLSLVDGQMLVPTVTVAEMAPIQPFDIIPNTPDWFLGYYPWRNLRVPVLSYETMNMKSSPKIGARGRVAVLNNTGLSDRVPFLGVLIQDIPHMVRIEEKDILEDTEAEKGRYDLMPIKLGAKPAVLPDVEAIEHAVLGLNLLR